MKDKPKDIEILYGGRVVAQPLLEDEVDRYFIKKKSIGEMVKGFDRWDASFFICSVMSGLSTFIYQSKPADSILQTTYYTQLAILGVLAGGSIIRKNDEGPFPFVNAVKEVGLKNVTAYLSFAAGYYGFEQIYNHLVR